MKPEIDAGLEAKFQTFWRDDSRRVDLLSRIKKETPKKAGSGKNGLHVNDVAAIVEMPPQVAQKLLAHLVEQGANIYVDRNRVFTQKTLQITTELLEDPVEMGEYDVNWSSKKVNGYRFGLISDAHFGSTRTNLGALRGAYNHFQKMGITNVFFVGNLIAGTVPRKYADHDLSLVAIEDQVDEMAKFFPKVDDIRTRYILGHREFSFTYLDEHPRSYFERSGRSDLELIGTQEVDLVFNPPEGKEVRVRLTNTFNEFTYSRTYQAQHQVENMAGGDRPHIWVSAGAQQYDYLPGYQGIHVIKLPGLQNQTYRMRLRKYACDVGLVVLTVVPDGNKRPKLQVQDCLNLGQGPSIK